MKLGEVLRKEREKKKLTVEKAAEEMSLAVLEYQQLEAGESPIESWGPKLAKIAIKLSVPTSRLISQTGKSAQANLNDGQCGELVKGHRERLSLTQQELSDRLGVPLEEIVAIENGNTPLEEYAPILLRFSELIEQPIFNLFYPCGLPFDQLEDYP